jgi:preprotein translocase subunit SecD
METSLRRKFILNALIFIVAAVSLVPTFVEQINRQRPEAQAIELPEWFSSVFTTKINLGLDLQGGLRLQYTVNVQKAIRTQLHNFGLDIRERVRKISESDMPEASVEPNEFNVLVLNFPNANGLKHIEGDFLLNYPVLNRTDGTDNIVYLTYDQQEIKRISETAVKQAVDKISERVNIYGLSEPEIRRVGTSDIEIQLAGLSKDKVDEAKRLIGRTAQLYFRIVDFQSRDWVEKFRAILPKDPENESKTLVTIDGGSLRSNEKKHLLSVVRRNPSLLPKDRSIGYEKIVPEATADDIPDPYWRTVVLLNKTKIDTDGIISINLTGERVANARVDVQDNKPQVSLTFDSKGGDIFGKLTTEHTKDYMAIMMDDEVMSAPVINEPILGGRCSISLGGFNYNQMLNEAQTLVAVLRSGALKAPVELLFDTEVGPTLGAESVRAGAMSLLLGGLIVIIFMAVYYRRAGMFADIALIFNVVLILAVLAAFKATLTLPGMAAIVLTIGMAVDANVIIYERIREELALEQLPRAAIDAGYKKALWTILDANITTAIAGFVLYAYGTGPVRGFAITLLIGIGTSLFTALVITRMLFEWSTQRRKLTELSI